MIVGTWLNHGFYTFGEFGLRFLKLSTVAHSAQLGALLEEDNVQQVVSSLQRDSLELDLERVGGSGGGQADLLSCLVVHNLMRRALEGRPPLTSRVIRHLRLGLSAGGGILALLQHQLVTILRNSALKVIFSSIGTFKDHREKIDFQEIFIAVVNWPISEFHGVFVCIIR